MSAAAGYFLLGRWQCFSDNDFSVQRAVPPVLTTEIVSQWGADGALTSEHVSDVLLAAAANSARQNNGISDIYDGDSPGPKLSESISSIIHALIMRTDTQPLVQQLLLSMYSPAH
eukprot:6187441-Pleurochrysis_carterae.AAC.4